MHGEVAEQMETEQPITLADWLELRDDMRAAEALLEDVQIAPADLSTYWAMSAELLALLQEIEEHLEVWRLRGAAADGRERYLNLRRRLVSVLARAEEIGLETEGD